MGNFKKVIIGTSIGAVIARTYYFCYPEKQNKPLS
jgi:hypothetical protein